MSEQPPRITIEPWLSVGDASRAADFYRRAFGAIELERLEGEPGVVEVARLAVGGATFWIQRDDDANPEALNGVSPVRMILTAANPDAVFAQALVAGALEIAPVVEANGWRVGRIADPSGHHWEIGKPLPT